MASTLSVTGRLEREMRPPAPKGQPVIVEFSIYVVDVNSINVEDMDFSGNVDTSLIGSIDEWKNKSSSGGRKNLFVT
ncbi:hypothetical protein EVAR_41697_1 [Eumeta japonica]|uniref:Uncharacterized protein n=1 Tax=Eumeta variegata TaxID=151549 RepID=A0A4C1VQI9_EUMVA|nr:hypothetical protein EVAR_41697_1 [Eumeta japonica]